MTAVLISRDLLIASRVADAFARGDRELLRIDRPSELDGLEGVSLVLVDWGEREPGWSEAIKTWLGRNGRTEVPRVIVFGPHIDLEAHAAARASGLGPMWARSKLLAEVGRLVESVGAVSPIRPGR